MANITPTPEWSVVYQLETSDEVLAGPEGLANIQAKQLANRTELLKKKLDASTPTYNTPEAGVDPVTGVGNGAYYNVHSTDDDSYLVEYQNIGGVPTPSGKSYPSYAALNNIQHNNLKGRDAAEAHPASAILDKSGKDQQWINDSTVICVKSIASLLAVELLNDGQLYSVESYRENTEYGGGLFRYDATSTETADNGTVFQHVAANGRFIRVNTDFLTVEDFGADPTYALDSTLAFQNFLNKFGDFRCLEGGKYKATAQLNRTGFFTAHNKAEIVFDFTNNTAFLIEAAGGEVDLGSLTFNGAADAGRLHRILVRINETSGVFGDKHKLINHHYESDTISLYLWNYGYSCLSNGTYKDITGIANDSIGDSIGPVRAVYGSGDRNCGALLIRGGLAENINNVDSGGNNVLEDADAFVVQLPHKADLIVDGVAYANVGKRLVKSNANSKSITKVVNCQGSSAWTSASPTDPENIGMYSIASAYAGVLQFHDNAHVGGICHHMIETGGKVDVIEHSNIFEPEYSFQSDGQNTRIFRHSATGDSKIIHGLSIVRNVASGGYVEGGASVIELANIQDLAVGGADLYNLNNHIAGGNIITGRTTQYVHRYRGTIGSFSVNGNIYKDWQDCIYLGPDLDAALMIGSVSGNLMKNVSRNLVSEFGAGTAGKVGYSGNYSSDYAAGGKSAVLGQTLPAPTITAGGGTALPATPLGYLNVSVNGVASYIPYYR